MLLAQDSTFTARKDVTCQVNDIETTGAELFYFQIPPIKKFWLLLFRFRSSEKLLLVLQLLDYLKLSGVKCWDMGLIVFRLHFEYVLLKIGNKIKRFL